MYDLYSLNFIVFIFFLTFMFFLHSNDFIKMLYISELLWILLYTICLISALLFNNISVLVVSLFFLMFSAAEISIGVLLLILRVTITSKTTN